MESEEYMNRKSRKQRREAEVSIFITIIITIIVDRSKEGEGVTHLVENVRNIVSAGVEK